MKAGYHEIAISPAIFARGFWLYAWLIIGPRGRKFCYIGMTGDVTGVAQSPFARAGSHFGSNKTANQIRRYLKDDHNLEPEACRSFKFMVYGPIRPYQHNVTERQEFELSRQMVGAIERKLFEEAKKVGYVMLNRKCPDFADNCDDRLWRGAQQAFALLLNPSR